MEINFNSPSNIPKKYFSNNILRSLYSSFRIVCLKTALNFDVFCVNGIFFFEHNSRIDSICTARHPIWAENLAKVCWIPIRKQRFSCFRLLKENYTQFKYERLATCFLLYDKMMETVKRVFFSMDILND